MELLYSLYNRIPVYRRHFHLAAIFNQCQLSKKGCLWTFLLVNFGALLRKRKHYVKTWQTVSVLKERRKRNSKKDSYSSERVKKSPNSCLVREQRSFGVVGSAERPRTRQHFVASAGLACAAARSLPAVCTLARLQSTAEHRRPRERDTMNALV